MNDYTHYRWIVVDKVTGKQLPKTIVAKDETEAKKYLQSNERLSSKIGGMNLTKKN